MHIHVSRERMAEFCARNSSAAEFDQIAGEIARCDDCRAIYRTAFKEQGKGSFSMQDLSPEDWLSDDHASTDQMHLFIEQRLDELELEMLEQHLAICPPCHGKYQSLLNTQDTQCASGLGNSA